MTATSPDFSVLPTLYRLRNGKLQLWRTWVEQPLTAETDGKAFIKSEYGYETGKLQQAVVIVTEGKNLGRSNATTVFEQANLDAQSAWNKKTKEGYVEDRDKALAGDNGLGDVILPMLAHRYDKHGHKLVYPCLAQPKLDGHRCIAKLRDGKAYLQSRGGDPITQLPHIVAELERKFPTGSIDLDGELYNHDYRNNFDDLSSAIRQQTEPHADHRLVQYHTYDVALAGKPYIDRVPFLLNFGMDGAVRRVMTRTINDEDELLAFFDECLQLGYEGAMAKNLAGLYTQDKRSYDVLKLKDFVDNDFEIIGVQEGKGKMAGHAAKFVCLTAEGTQFEPPLNAPMDKLKAYYDDHSLWRGMLLVVRHQGFTQKNKVPRIPKGLRLRKPGE